MSNRKNNLAAVLTPTRSERVNPMQNPRLKTDLIEPLGAFVLVEIDAKQKKTKGGIMLPDGSFGNVYSDASVKEAKQFGYDTTGVIITCGPDVENVAVGDRILLPFPPVPCKVTDSKDGEPLGLLDSRDIICKVAS